MPRTLLLVTSHPPHAEPASAIHHLLTAFRPRFDRIVFATVVDRSAAPRLAGGLECPDTNSLQARGDMETLTVDVPGAFPSMASVRHWLTRRSPESARFELAWPRLDAVATQSDVIVLQSPLAAQLFPRLRERARSAFVTYLASEPGDATPGVAAALARLPVPVDRVVVFARTMRRHLENLASEVLYVPVGVKRTEPLNEQALAPGGRHAIVPAWHFFDSSVLRIAALSLPGIRFHVFGADMSQRYPTNVEQHATRSVSTMERLLPGACLGLAAYCEVRHCEDLADSSLELAAFAHYGIPAVCPDFALREHPSRHGYEVGRSASVRDALRRARLQAPTVERAPDWSDVASAVLDPRRGLFTENVTSPIGETVHAG